MHLLNKKCLLSLTQHFRFPFCPRYKYSEAAKMMPRFSRERPSLSFLGVADSRLLPFSALFQSETESDKACQTSISLVPNKSRTQSHKIDLSRTYSQINMNLQTALSGILGSQVSLPIAISLPGLHWSSSFLHDYSSPQCMDLTKFTVVIVNTLCNLR